MRVPSCCIAVVAGLFVAGAARAACEHARPCRENGHTTMTNGLVGGVLHGVEWPYSEDIASGSFQPFGKMTVDYDPQGGWTPIQSGCLAIGERNLAASTQFHAILRAQPTISRTPSPTALPDSSYELQLRLGATRDDPQARVAAHEVRRLRGKYPQADHLGGIASNLPPGAYVYSLWVRLLDPGSITFDNTWISAQGIPAHAGDAARATEALEQSIDTTWQAVGPPLVTTPTGFTSTIDLILGASFRISSGAAGAGVRINFSVDDVLQPAQFGEVTIPAALPDGINAFDSRAGLEDAPHTVRLYLRTTAGSAVIRDATVEYATLPVSDRVPPMVASGVETDAVTVADVEEGDQPREQTGITGSCGRWTKILELDVPSYSAEFNWLYQGFVQLVGDGSGTPQGDIAIENVVTDGDGSSTVSVDHGVTSIEAGADGIYLTGEAYRWGNWNGNKVRVWARRRTLCDGDSAAGAFTIGKRWMSVKLTPVEGCEPAGEQRVRPIWKPGG